MQVLIDDRERSVITFVEKFSEKYHISYKVKRITTGDYAIIHSNQIIAIIERKTYTDLAASFRDGRSNNKNKLLKLRSETSCIIIYLIEGPAFPDNNDLFGNVPYKHLVAHLDHLMIRDNIQIQTTFSPEHSAERIMQIAANCTTIRPTIFTDKYINKVIINVDDPENKEDILQIEMKNNTEDDPENEDIVLVSELKSTDKKKQKIKKHKKPIDSYEESNKNIIYEIKQNLVKQELNQISAEHKEVIGGAVDSVQINIDTTQELKSSEIIEQTAESILSKKQESEINIREYMLQFIPGVGNILSTILSDASINLKKLLLSSVDVDSIAKLKYSTGGSVGLIKAGKILDSCRMLMNSKSQVANKIRMKILHAIPLISKLAAEKILSSIEFKSLFVDEQIYLALQNIYKSPKNKIGIKASNNIKKYLYD
jgi:ERCC4-type nuclease